jgi:hypothetical protein
MFDFLSAYPFDKIGRPLEVVNAFGGKDGFHQAMHELQAVIYENV